MEGWWNKLWLVVLGGVLAIFLGWLPAGADPVVRLQPSLSTPGGGVPFDVFVEISAVSDLYNFQLDIRFDPALLSAVSVREGSFLREGGSTYFIPGTIDNETGSICFIMDTLLNPAAVGVSGRGNLAVLKFQALAGGTSPIDLSGVILLDSSLGDIAFKAEGSTITAVPEPPSLFLIGFSSLLLAGSMAKYKRQNPFPT